MNAKTIALIQAQDNLRAAKRSGKSGTRLLDDGENNVGNSIILQPQTLPAGVDLTTVKQQGINGRILNLTAESKTGQSATLVMTAARQNDKNGAIGPITGIVEFGNGTQVTRVEFDIPVGPHLGGTLTTVTGAEPEDSGAVIQVPTSVMRAYARYDNAFITPTEDGIAFGASGSPAFPLLPGAGPFAPNTGFTSFGIFLPPCPANIKAFANYFGRHHTKLYKTQYLYIGSSAAPVVFGSGNPTVVPNYYYMPPFAKSIQVISQPAVAMTLTLYDQLISNVIFQESHSIAAGTYPIFPVTGQTSAYSLGSSSINDTVSAVKVVFEIGF